LALNVEKFIKQVAKPIICWLLRIKSTKLDGWLANPSTSRNCWSGVCRVPPPIGSTIYWSISAANLLQCSSFEKSQNEKAILFKLSVVLINYQTILALRSQNAGITIYIWNYHRLNLLFIKSSIYFGVYNKPFYWNTNLHCWSTIAIRE